MEQRIVGTTHAEVGAYLLGLWGLPNSIIEAVAFHHRPHGFAEGNFNTIAIVHFADALEYEMDAEMPPNTPNNRLNSEYLDLLARNDRLPVWRKVCSNIQHEDKMNA